jgi:DNA-binding transcriptional LysR family regulator
MEIRQLRHFVAAAEAGNLRKASEKIHISHPALSMSIKNLEADLGVVLLNKNRRGVQMTVAGEQFLKSAHALLRQIDVMRTSLQGTEGSPAGNVRLGLPYGINNAIAAPLFRILSSRFPGINLDILEGNTTFLERSFEDNLLDLMVNYDFEERMDQKCEALYEEDLYFVRAYDPEIAKVEEIDLQSLEDYPIGSSPGRYSLRRTLDKYAAEHGIKFNFVVDFRSASASIKITEAGLICTVCPWDWIHDQVASKRLCAAKIVNPSMSRTACLIYSLGGKPVPAFDATVGAIKEAISLAKSEGKLRGTLMEEQGKQP